MGRKALVTGGAGFIGSHVVDLFLAEGWNVDIVDNLASGKRERIPPGATFHEIDISSPEAAALVERERYDVICHLAAQIDVRKSVDDPVHDATVNVLGTLNLLEAVRRSRSPTRFVFSSTGGAIYGSFAPPPTPEDAGKDPDAPYGITKMTVEHYLAYYSRVHKLDTAVLRYGNVYGPRQDPHGEAGVVAIFCGRILAGRPMTVYGDGSQTRDYVYVSDVARANLLAATVELPPVARSDSRAFNIGTGVETPVVRLAEVLNAAAGASVPVERAPARLGELHRSAVDNAKARAVLGWSPRMSLEKGLEETFRYFAERAGVVRQSS
jgi:UDP-glucose 4-epimerase